MKKMLLSLVLFMFLLINVNAEEIKEIGNKKYSINEIVYMCEDGSYYVEDFLPIPNKIIISNGENVKIYKEGKCQELSVQDRLDIYNKTIKYTKYVGDEDTTTLSYYDTYDGFASGFVLNTDDFKEDEAYYVLYNNAGFDQVDPSEIDKTKIKEYYVERYFKHISSPKLEDNKNYYIYYEETEMFELNTKEVKDEEYLNIYEMISYDEAFQNERKYSLTEKDRELVISKNNIDTNKYVVSEDVIGNDIYYMVTLETDDYDILSIKYYDKKGNLVFKDYENKFIDVYNNYVITFNLNNTLIELYDKDFNYIKGFEFDNSTSFELIENDEDAYILFDDEEGNHNTYLIDSEIEINYCYYFLIVGLIIVAIIVYYIFDKKRK